MRGLIITKHYFQRTASVGGETLGDFDRSKTSRYEAGLKNYQGIYQHEVSKRQSHAGTALRPLLMPVHACI